ncbi:MAG: right-handed parallel beta-helix repeat-containing protein [Verrucomicrobiota bacterium]
MKKTPLFILAALTCASAAITQAADLYVSPDGNQTPPFANWTQAATNIQDAVDAASDGDTIYLADHTYSLKETVTVEKAITIKGHNGSENCVVDGRNQIRCLDISDATLADLTIQHGFIQGGFLGDPERRYGGGVYARNSVVHNCVFRENGGNQGLHGILPAGAALAARDGSIVSDCTFYDNNNEGDGFSDPSTVHIGSDSLIERCIIRNNVTSVGALDCDHSTVVQCLIYDNQFRGVTMVGGTMRDCQIFDNEGSPSVIAIVVGSAVRPSNQGGGVHISEGGVVSRCLIQNNSSRTGGGVYIENGTLRSSLVLDNLSHYDRDHPPGFFDVPSDGGGIYIKGRGHVENCTVLGNESSHTTGGVFWESSFDPADETVIRNNILYSNSGFNLPEEAYVVTLQHNCIQGGTGLKDGNINSDPQVAADYRLSESSPCRDTGTNQDWMAEGGDYAGITRVVNTDVDMGALEFVAPLAITQIQKADEQITLNWTSSPGAVYQVEGSDDLSANAWENVGAAVTATGTVSSQTEAVGPRLRRFYRCRHVLIE